MPCRCLRLVLPFLIITSAASESDENLNLEKAFKVSGSDGTSFGEFEQKGPGTTEAASQTRAPDTTALNDQGAEQKATVTADDHGSGFINECLNPKRHLVQANLESKKKKVKKQVQQKNPQRLAAFAAVLVGLTIVVMAISTCAKPIAEEAVALGTRAMPSAKLAGAPGTSAKLTTSRQKAEETEQTMPSTMAKPLAATTVAAGTRAAVNFERIRNEESEQRAPGATEKPPAATTMAAGTRATDNFEIRLTVRAKSNEEEIFSFFSIFDHDGNGKISESELSKAARDMVRLADNDGDLRLNSYEFDMYQGGEPCDGQVSFEEFAVKRAEGFEGDQVEDDVGDADEDLGGDTVCGEQALVGEQVGVDLCGHEGYVETWCS